VKSFSVKESDLYHTVGLAAGREKSSLGRTPKFYKSRVNSTKRRNEKEIEEKVEKANRGMAVSSRGLSRIASPLCYIGLPIATRRDRKLGPAGSFRSKSFSQSTRCQRSGTSTCHPVTKRVLQVKVDDLHLSNARHRYYPWYAASSTSKALIFKFWSTKCKEGEHSRSCQ
jgi:hypothetical protein